MKRCVLMRHSSSTARIYGDYAAFVTSGINGKYELAT